MPLHTDLLYLPGHRRPVHAHLLRHHDPGGLGSTVGAIIGGLILGLFESLTATYIGMGWAPVGRFVIFVAALIFIPGGVASLLKSKKLGK